MTDSSGAFDWEMAMKFEGKIRLDAVAKGQETSRRSEPRWQERVAYEAVRTVEEWELIDPLFGFSGLAPGRTVEAFLFTVGGICPSPGVSRLPKNWDGEPTMR